MKMTRQKSEAEFIRKYIEWPRWPFLPMKLSGKVPCLPDNIGVLMCDQKHDDAVKGVPGAKFILYHVCLFDLPNGKAGWDAAPRTEFDSLEALLSAGWIID